MGLLHFKTRAGALSFAVAALLAVPVAGAAAKQDPTLGRATQLAAAPAAAPAPASAPTLNICSFDSSRSRAPFATATGSDGYGQMRSDLLNTSNFGPSGKVHRTVNIEAGVPTMTASDLTGCNVFFTSVFTGALSSSEASALKAAVKHGMKVITDADSDSDEQTSVNSLLAALGFTGTVGPNTICSNDANGGNVRLTGTGNAELYGPFGDLRGNTWGTSLAAQLNGLGKDVSCGSASLRAIKGAVMVGGDPSGFDLFTSPSGSLYNPTNEAAYLNYIGTSH